MHDPIHEKIVVGEPIVLRFDRTLGRHYLLILSVDVHPRFHQPRSRRNNEIGVGRGGGLEKLMHDDEIEIARPKRLANQGGITVRTDEV